MMGFKSYNSAQATIAGIEFYRMLKKGQHINVKKYLPLISFMY